MERYYFTFMLNDVEHHNCFHVEEAETYEEARDKMVERFGTGWGDSNTAKMNGKFLNNGMKM